MKKKRNTTTMAVGLLAQLYEADQLELAPEFQRNSVWPRAAKAYLMDTILKDLPIAPLMFRRQVSGGRPSYEVVDGQQRLRTVFSYLDNRFGLDDDEKRRFKALEVDEKEQILNYDFVIEELIGFTTSEIRDIFKRANRYTVRLNNQEIRHAQEEGEFAVACNQVASWWFWSEYKVFTAGQMSRMLNLEFAAELLILLAEGPQDKKDSIDTWYGKYRTEFDLQDELLARLRKYLQWIESACPRLAELKLRKPVHLYALIGALDQMSVFGENLDAISPDGLEDRLFEFEAELDKVAAVIKDPLDEKRRPTLDRDAQRYQLAASRQTDNIRPRETRIAVMTDLLIS